MANCISYSGDNEVATALINTKINAVYKNRPNIKKTIVLTKINKMGDTNLSKSILIYRDTYHEHGWFIYN